MSIYHSYSFLFRLYIYTVLMVDRCVFQSTFLIQQNKHPGIVNYEENHCYDP